MTLFFVWLAIWFVISISIGPVSILTMHRTLHKGLSFGIISGVGIALADIFFAYISKSGATFFQNFLLQYEVWIQLVASIIFLILWFYFFFAPKAQFHSKYAKESLLKNFWSAFFLNLLNPINFVLFGFVFVQVVHLDQNIGTVWDILLLSGIFLWACTWRTLLNWWISYFKISVNRLYIINKIFGGIIIVVSIVSFFKMFN